MTNGSLNSPQKSGAKKSLPKKRSAWQRRLYGVVNALYPTMGMKRYRSYIIHRIGRMKSTDEAIAKGFAAGACVSMTPLLGLHFVCAVIVAWLTRGNMVVALIATAVGNPWTFPFIFYGGHVLGGIVLQNPAPRGHFRESMGAMKQFFVDLFSWATSGAWQGRFVSGVLDLWDSLLVLLHMAQNMIVGGVVMAVVVWFVSYKFILQSVGRYRRFRQRQIKAKKRKPKLYEMLIKHRGKTQ